MRTELPTAKPLVEGELGPTVQVSVVGPSVPPVLTPVIEVELSAVIVPLIPVMLPVGVDAGVVVVVGCVVVVGGGPSAARAKATSTPFVHEIRTTLPTASTAVAGDPAPIAQVIVCTTIEVELSAVIGPIA